MSYVLGVDLGTSSLKGLVVDKNGVVVAEKTSDYPLEVPQAGFSEQNPRRWVEACRSVLTELMEVLPDFKEKLEGISFSGQMHSLVLLDEDNQVLRNAILWNDVRTTEECKEIMSDMGEELLEITQNVALEGFTLPKILWVQKHEPEIWAKVAHLMLPKDYLGFWLTKNYHMDYSDAAGTLLLDLKTRTWSKEITTRYNIDESVLPTLIDSHGQIGVMRDSLKTEFGFKQDIKIFAGGADNACAAVGAGILSEGVGMCSIGTSGVFLSYEDSCDRDYHGNLHLFAHAEKDAHYSMGVTLAAGNSLTWFRDTFAEDESFAELLKDVSTVSVGSDGLLFTPYIVGERTPYVDSQIRGSFIGIDTHHRLTHFARAVLEGITFSLKDSQMIMQNFAGKTFDTIISVGGGAKNPDWLQMQADIFNAKIVTLEVEQGPGLGAAMLAAVGCGWYENLTACSKYFVSYKHEISPIAENVEKYQKVYKLYKSVYPSTNQICHGLLSLEETKELVEA